MSNRIQVEISARHLHLSKEHLAVLFGEGAELTCKKYLSQPGQFACEERVHIIGPKGKLANVIIIGPTRAKTQVEVSLSDARILGLNPPIRPSGDLEGSEGCRLVGPAGELYVPECVIVAKRHIHMSPEDAKALGLHDLDDVYFKVETPDRTMIFGDMVVRTNDQSATFAHIDTDEANAAGISGRVFGELFQ